MILPPMILSANLVKGQSTGDPLAEPAILPPRSNAQVTRPASRAWIAWMSVADPAYVCAARHGSKKAMMQQENEKH